MVMQVSLRLVGKHDDAQLKRKPTLNFSRFLSFNEHTLSSIENQRCVNQVFRSKSIEKLENNIDETSTISFSYTCKQCSIVFVSEYGLDYHINMSHSNQSIYCSDCNTKFRSRRALKNHQQQFHLTYSEHNLPDYSHISSYLVVGFSTNQFPFIAKNACEQKRLPLGYLSSKLFQCQYCHLSFPCSRTLRYHILNNHEQYEYNLCRDILYDIILHVEQNLNINNDNDIDSIKFLLSKQASNIGLIDKKLSQEYHHIKQEQHNFIFPSCQHDNRTCASLCLKNLSSYNKLTQNYPFKIATLPKGTPFAHGSIVSKSSNKSTVNSPIVSKDTSNINQKRLSLKRVKSSLSDDLASSPSKKKFLPTVEQPVKTNETNVIPGEQSSSSLISPKKLSTKTKTTYVRSLSSMSSNSSISTRNSAKNSRQYPASSLKRSISPTITLAVERSAEKRRRQRELRKAKHSLSSSTSVKVTGEIEQENDEEDEDDDHDSDSDNIVSIKNTQSKHQRRNKQRQASNSSVEYVQILNHDQQTIPSLNNIENLKEKSEINDEEIIICHSPPFIKKSMPSSNRNHSEKSRNSNSTYNSNGHQPSDYDENVRVRCKICGNILQGRSRFSKHVLTMHSHLVKNNISTIKQQSTTIVR